MARTPEHRPGDDEWLRELDEYEADMAREAKKARLEREAGDEARAIAKLVEKSKPIWERSYFSLDEIADALARPPGRARVDAEEREHVCRDLIDRAARGEINDNDGGPGVFVLSGRADRPFELLKSEPPRPEARDVISITIIDPDSTYLSRRALHRSLRESELAGSRRLLKEWFGLGRGLSTEKDAAPSERPAQERVNEWMVQNVTRSVKRDAALKDACGATGATWRQALKAYRRLPPDKRRGRGAPKKPCK